MSVTIKSNSTSQMALKTSDTWHSCSIFIRWHYLTRPWPWTLLSMRLIPTYMVGLLHPLRGISAKLGVAAAISPVSVSYKAKRDDFDVWPGIHLTCDLLKSFLIPLKGTHWELSIWPLTSFLPQAGSGLVRLARPPVREQGKGQSVPPSGVIGQIPQRDAD